MRQYPRISEVNKKPKLTKKICECKGCNNIATRLVTVQITYMRGDDEIYQTCDDHKRNMPAILGLGM